MVAPAVAGTPFVPATLVNGNLVQAQPATPGTAITRPAVDWQMVKDEFEAAHQTAKYREQLSQVRDDDKPTKPTVNVTTDYAQLLLEQNNGHQPPTPQRQPKQQEEARRVLRVPRQWQVPFRQEVQVSC